MKSRIVTVTALWGSLGLCACIDERAVEPPETVFTLQPPTWFEDAWSFYEVSPDGGSALFGVLFGRRLYDLSTGDELPHEGDVPPWRPEDPSLPSDAVAVFSPDGRRIAYYRSTDGSGPSLHVRTGADDVEYDLGGRVTGQAWAPGGETLYATTFREDGVSSLFRLGHGGTGEPDRLRDALDGLAPFNRIAVSEDGRRVYMALASSEPPDPYARHRPRADRDTDIYAVDVATGALEAVVTAPGDDLAPQIVLGALYWTHNDYLDVVAIVPVEGGAPRDIVGDAQIPYWSPDGSQIAFTVGGWRIADWALNMDAWVVDVDDVGDRRSEPRPLIFGYHEDFTPAWSPDGEWLAYHSHRSREPVSHYDAEGGTDDIYLRRFDGVMQDEIRLMDFGLEVGVADWDRTGTRLYFDSRERGGQQPGVSHAWIATIDTESGRARSIDRLPLPSGFGGTVQAAWSPVADELAVVERIEGDRHAVWVMVPDGSDAERLFEYRASTYGGIDWTPDGSRLIYGALSDGRMQLFSYDLASGESVQLTQGRGDVVHPQVSPDGRWIAASRLRHVKELRRMPLGGSAR